MPRIGPGMKKPPPGFEVLEEKLDEFEEEMKIAVQEESNGVVGKTVRDATADRKRKRDAYDDEDDEKKEDGEKKDGEKFDASEEEEAPIPPLWKIAKINYQRTRYVYDCLVKEKSINMEVFQYCVEMQFIDGGLARKWRLPGYEKLCCSACATPGGATLAAGMVTRFSHRNKEASKTTKESSNDKSVCICRVPANQRKNKRFLACSVCGCKGCCSAGS